MDHLELTSRPSKEVSVSSAGLFWSSVVGFALFLIAALTDTGRFVTTVFIFGLILMGFTALILLPSYLSERRFVSSYPSRLQQHLQNPLSPEDYEKLARLARRHPETKEWITEAMGADGQIRYRDAEQLQSRINQHLASLPYKQLSDTLGKEQKIN